MENKTTIKKHSDDVVIVLVGVRGYTLAVRHIWMNTFQIMTRIREIGSSQAFTGFSNRNQAEEALELWTLGRSIIDVGEKHYICE